MFRFVGRDKKLSLKIVEAAKKYAKKNDKK